ncbi:MAG TPA: alpha/beta hydrolase [Acidimicrobiales bacterium]|jgi:pimeloyl-ACP methyl ester carboxylesterase
MFDFDVAAVTEAANNDGAFLLNARYWTAVIGLDMESDRYEIHVADGRVVEMKAVEQLAGDYDIRISAPAGAWAKLLQAVPPPRYDDIRFGGLSVGFEIDGDLVGAVGPYYGAVQDLVAILRRARSGDRPSRPVPDVDRLFDSTVGRYVYIRVDGVQYRVYFEESGTGSIPMVLQHTAGADGRQWRHVLEDLDYQRDYRMIAYDLPYHGKSLPPTGVPWWESEYRLTKDFLIKTVVAICETLELDRPVYMGCSIGGHLAPDLALAHPDKFRAVIGINAGLATRLSGNTDTEESWYHPRVSNDWKAAAMLGNTAPTSPESYRRETTWIYSQGAPPALKGDVFYYSRGHDLTAEQAAQIDTSQVDVYLLTGEYDPLAGEEGTARLAANIPGCHFEVIPGLGHFGPSENPEDFKPILLDTLQAIAKEHS